MFQKQFFKSLLIIPFLYSYEVLAGPALPLQQLDLAVLDLNGAPFRYFHLANYQGDVLNSKHIPQNRNPLKQITNPALVKLEQTQQVTGLLLPKLNYTASSQEIADIASQFDEGLLQKKQNLPY